MNSGDGECCASLRLEVNALTSGYLEVLDRLGEVRRVADVLSLSWNSTEAALGAVLRRVLEEDVAELRRTGAWRLLPGAPANQADEWAN